MIFRRTLLRLTITYSAIVLILLAAFAIGVYSYVTSAFDFDAVAEVPSSGDVAEQGFATLRTALLVCYAVLVVVVPALSFVMARRALAPIRASYDAQQRLVDDASHEFRTPLAVVQGELELALLRERTPAEYRDAIGGSLDVIQHLITLTGDLLLLARGTRQEIRDSFEIVPITSIIGAALNTLDGPDRAGPVISIEADTPAAVRGSADLLARAAANLLQNALTATPADGRITITARADAQHAWIDVHDTGIGMTPEQLYHARERFWRADRSRASRGHGIGLSLVTAIADAHDGRLNMRSQPGHGTTATLELPRADQPSSRL
ncbi:HAMP domain-containing histidine kinase [Rathayibacter sp. ZW T2_19]|uniref:histidine kinase n=1 Tax=Rathayibacter rubneri TaxID=2950106 RepID=A0A9X2DXN7_9MICO|nr:HAMP domain-containing sensor histidine kinase [Rathayibacter rubneri]MCM6762488.1 HAMP domain-containing histidine kinase [Rathayibacter rubneri]